MDAMAGRLRSRSCCRSVGLLILGPSDLGPTSIGATSAKPARHLWGDTMGTLRPWISGYPSFSSPPLRANIPITKSDPVCFIQFLREKANIDFLGCQRASLSEAKTCRAAPSHPGPPHSPAQAGTLLPSCSLQGRRNRLRKAQRRRGSAESPASVTGTQRQPPRTGSRHGEPSWRLQPAARAADGKPRGDAAAAGKGA